MKILTIGPSPTLLTQCGRINKCLIESLSSAGHDLATLSWHHDIEYFLPNQVGSHHFGSVPVYPFLDQKGLLPAFSFDVMKKVQPQVVITIGDYHEVEFVQAIKALYGGLFKWVAVIAHGGSDVLPESGLNLSYADDIAVTTKAATDSIFRLTTRGKHVPFGQDMGSSGAKAGEFRILSMGKNSQLSNVPALIEAAADADVRTTIHTNLHDLGGDYDMEYLIARTKKAHLFDLPKRFVSVKDGYTQTEIATQYGSHHAIVDCSLQSQTGLTLLEGMSSGCVPVGMECGAVGEILSQMPEWCRFLVPHSKFTVQRGERACVINTKDLTVTLKKLKASAYDKDWLEGASHEAVAVARKFSKELFATSIKEMVEAIVTCKHSVAVDSF